jgi:hypothetical protein
LENNNLKKKKGGGGQKSPGAEAGPERRTLSSPKANVASFHLKKNLQEGVTRGREEEGEDTEEAGEDATTESNHNRTQVQTRFVR